MMLQLFVTCLIDSLFPEIGEATVEVLARAGAQIGFPEGQTCCGQPAMNAGYFEEARRMARNTIDVLTGAPGPVIVPSGSCAAMIKHGYLELFAEDRIWLSRARELAKRTYELSEFLVDRMRVVRLGAAFQGHLAYHPSCHLLRGLGVNRQPMQLLESVAGVELTPLSPECCGFGGVFSMDHAPISEEMLAATLKRAQESGADTIVSCDVSCLMQMEGGLRRTESNLRCAHLAQILAGKEPGLR
jgi:L-lactate dehydrogenase complex protein LldE